METRLITVGSKLKYYIKKEKEVIDIKEVSGQ
jgi:hypothetical protein